jgi:HSP20 family protein
MIGELMRWNPTQELSNWHRDIDDLFGRFFERHENPLASWMPRMESYRKDNEYVIRIDLPGVNPNDVNIQAEGNVLTITGERKSEDKGPQYHETFYGKFERQLALPQGVDPDKIVAHYEHGVLEIRIPVPAQLAGRTIPIKIDQKDKKKLELPNIIHRGGDYSKGSSIGETPLL